MGRISKVKTVSHFKVMEDRLKKKPSLPGTVSIMNTWRKTEEDTKNLLYTVLV